MEALRRVFLAPTAVIMVLLLALPLAIIAAYSFLTRGSYGGQGLPWTFENYTRFLDPLYLSILVQSFLLAGAATALCAILGFPLALSISRAGSRKRLLLHLVMLPFWTSLLVRTYAWMFLLRDTGLINTILMKLGLISEPLPLLYNYGAVLLGLVYSYLPFLVLPAFASLERVDQALIDAAADLGARPLETVAHVILPLASPGLAAGSVLVFIASLGTFLVSDLLGGGKTILIGNLIQNQFTTARDWPFGSAASLVLMTVVLLLLFGIARSARSELS